MRGGKWKLHLPRKQRGVPELYDLAVDPSESNNVAALHPDVVADMSGQLKNWVTELPDQYEKKDGKRNREQDE